MSTLTCPMTVSITAKFKAAKNEEKKGLQLLRGWRGLQWQKPATQRIPLIPPCSMNHWHPSPKKSPTEMRDRHSTTQTPVSLAAVPSLSLVQDALLSFAPDSEVGSSGLRLQHIEGSLLPGLMRSLHAVVSIMAEGNIVSWIASASLAASRRKDGKAPTGRRGRDSSTSHSESPAGHGVPKT